jgi:hypothetical protein
MVWAHSAVVLKRNDFHNCFILHQIKGILFFAGRLVFLERKLQTSIFEP